MDECRTRCKKETIMHPWILPHQYPTVALLTAASPISYRLAEPPADDNPRLFGPGSGRVVASAP